MAKRKTTQSQENPGYMGPEWNPSLPIPGSSRPSGPPPRPAGPIWGPPPIGRPPGTFRPGSNPGGGAWRDGPGSGFDVLQNPFSTNPTRPFPFDPLKTRNKTKDPKNPGVQNLKSLGQEGGIKASNNYELSGEKCIIAHHRLKVLLFTVLPKMK